MTKKYAYGIILLIMVNLILRYPLTPHEIGWDSFAIHSIANSVSTLGYAKWWLEPTSIFGFYPYSYASAVPFLLSAISQNIAVDMEWAIWLFCLLMGIYCVFTAYIMGGAIKNDNTFKILMAIIYSTSNGVLYFTTWTLSTRGMFIVLLPLFIYLLMKSRNSTKHIALMLFFAILLAATHHLVYFLIIPLISYTIVAFIFKFKEHIHVPINYNKFFPFIIFLFFVVIFCIPFFTRAFIEIGSRYVWLQVQFLDYAKNIGFLSIFMLGGFVYLLFKGNKNFNDWFLLVTLLGITPLLYVGKYTKWFFLPFGFILIGIGLINIIQVIMRNKKFLITSIIIFSLIISISLVSYFQFLHYLNDKDINSRHMEEKTYIGALWVKDNVEKPLFANEITTSERVLSVVKMPVLTGSDFNDLAYGLVNPDDLNITHSHSSSSIIYYFQEPYIELNPSSSWYLRSIYRTDINERNSYAQRAIEKFSLSYFVQNTYFYNVFTNSIGQKENKIYDNGKIYIWELGDTR